MSKQSTLFEEIRGFIISFLILGLWPSSKNSKYNILLKIYSFLCICSIICLFSYAIYFKHFMNGHSLSSIVEYSFLWSILSTHLIILIEALVKSDAHMRLIQKISHIDWLFKNKLQIGISYSEEKHSIFIRVIIMVFISMSVGIGVTIHLNYQHRITNFWYQCIFSVWILRVRSIQIILFVFLLSTRLRLLRNNIKELLPSQSFYTDVANRLGIFIDETKMFVLDSSPTRKSLYNRLLNLKQIYSELYEISQQINMTFGWSLIMIIAQNFINFIGDSYWIFCAFKKSNFAHAVDCIFLLVPIIIMLATLIHYSSSCSRNVSYILISIIRIHKLHDFFY